MNAKFVFCDLSCWYKTKATEPGEPPSKSGRWLQTNAPTRAQSNRSIAQDMDNVNQFPNPTTPPTGEPLNNLPRLITWADLAKDMPPIAWKWKPWLAKGYLTVFVGQPGSGKSTVLLDAVCRPFITGDEWLDGQPFTGEIRKVLWVEGEGVTSLNVNNARDFGIPLDGFAVISYDWQKGVSVEDDAQKKAIEDIAMHPEIGAIIFDSLSTIHGADENNSTKMIPILHWLVELAAKTQKPVVVTHHLNKLELLPGQDITINHVRGSTSIVQLARTVWAISQPDPNSPELKKMYVIKSNLDKFPEPLGLTITEEGVVPSELPRSLVRYSSQAPVTLKKAEQAAAFLETLFKDGPVPSAKVEQAVKEAGLSYHAAKRAKTKLGLISDEWDGTKWWRRAQDD